MPIHNLVFFGCFFNFMLRLMDGWGNWQRRHNVWGQEEYDLLGSMRYLHVHFFLLVPDLICNNWPRYLVGIRYDTSIIGTRSGTQSIKSDTSGINFGS